AQFAEATGNRDASIDASAGGAFSLFGGFIGGRTIELVPGARLVQAWRAQNWDPGVYSLVRFTLAADGAGTRVVLAHTSFPPGHETHLAGGWASNYWEPLTKYLG